MKVICAWCHDIIKPDDGTGLPASHGICLACKEIHYPDRKRQTVLLDKKESLRIRTGDGRH